MATLAFEFAFDHRSVGLEVGGQSFEVSHSGGRHTPIFGLITRVLEMAGVGRSEVTRILVGLGPGSYTGVRLAISTAQGWQLATGIPCVGQSSFQGLACAAARLGHPRVILAVDAQRQEFACASVDLRSPAPQWLSTPQLLGRDDLRQRHLAGETLMGPGLPKALGFGFEVVPSALDLITMTSSHPTLVRADLLTPVYLREASFAKAPPQRSLADLLPEPRIQ